MGGGGAWSGPCVEVLLMSQVETAINQIANELVILTTDSQCMAVHTHQFWPSLDSCCCCGHTPQTHLAGLWQGVPPSAEGMSTGRFVKRIARTQHWVNRSLSPHVLYGMNLCHHHLHTAMNPDDNMCLNVSLSLCACLHVYECWMSLSLCMSAYECAGPFLTFFVRPVDLKYSNSSSTGVVVTLHVCNKDRWKL